jgi:hypothetical protein
VLTWNNSNEVVGRDDLDADRMAADVKLGAPRPGWKKTERDYPNADWTAAAAKRKPWCGFSRLIDRVMAELKCKHLIQGGRVSTSNEIRYNYESADILSIDMIGRIRERSIHSVNMHRYEEGIPFRNRQLVNYHRDRTNRRPFQECKRRVRRPYQPSLQDRRKI